MNSPRNILFLAHRVPYPPNRGDRIRSYHILKFLSERASVHLGTLADEPLEPGAEQTLNAICRRTHVELLGRGRWLNGAKRLLLGGTATVGLFESSRLRKELVRWTTETRFDAVFVFCSSMAQYLDLPGLKNVPVVVDLVDVDSQKFYDYAAKASGPKRWLYQLEGRRLRSLETSLAERATAVLLVSEAEANIYREFAPNSKTWAIKNGVDLDYFAPQDVEEKACSCVFVGAFDYPPNIAGAAWFCEHVWPRLRQEFPDATLTLVGRNPAPSVRALANLPGVTVTGSVNDVRPYVASAAVAITPLQIARGIQNKVLEAMAMSKAVIGSPQAAEGLLVQQERELLIAREPEQWHGALRRLFTHPELRTTLGSAARQYVQTHHDWPACLHPLEKLLEL